MASTNRTELSRSMNRADGNEMWAPILVRCGQTRDPLPLHKPRFRCGKGCAARHAGRPQGIALTASHFHLLNGWNDLCC